MFLQLQIILKYIELWLIIGYILDLAGISFLLLPDSTESVINVIGGVR